MKKIKVSKKGQIVIPAKFRDRLNIQPGHLVKFSIRGQVLQVEVEHDVVDEIKYLTDKKGTLGESDFDENQMGEIIRDLLSQQFYNGNDMITDRVGRREYKVRGAESIFQETINIMVHAGRHWLDGNYIDTFHELTDIFELDFASIISNFNGKLKGMEIGGPEMIQMMGGEVIFAMVTGEILTQFRTRVGDETQEKIVREAEILGFNVNLGDETIEEKVVTSLADKYSILMNLRVLREMARVSIKSIGERRFQKISDELIAEFSEMKMPDKVKRRIARREKRRKLRKGQTLETTEAGSTDEIDDQDEEYEFEMPSADGISEPVKSEASTDLPELPDFDF